MLRRVVVMVLLAGSNVGVAAPAAAAGGSVDSIRDFDSVVAVARSADFPIASLMRAHCTVVVRVERPDGSARETQLCQLTDDPVMIPEFQGTPPTQAFIDEPGACVWSSDYWAYKNGTDVPASSIRIVVTPSGHVMATSTYPAQPLDCE